MRKAIALCLSLLLLLLPVLGSAATADQLLEKYASQGYAEITTVSFGVGESIQALIPEEVRSMAEDLINAISFRFSRQAAEGMEQDSVSLRISGEDALRFDIAAAPQGLYASSNITGERIFALSADELAMLLQNAVQQLVGSGVITEEQLAKMTLLVQSAIADPAAFVESMLGEPDLTGVLTALVNIAGKASTDPLPAPEAFPEGVSCIRLTLTADDLKTLGTEAAKLIASLPAFEQLSGIFSLTEENLTESMTQSANILAEDLVVTFWTSEDASAVYLTVQGKLREDDDIVSVDGTVLARTQTEGIILSAAAVLTEADDGEEDVHLSFDFTGAGEDFNGSCILRVDDQTVQTVFSGKSAETDAASDLTLDASVRMLDEEETVLALQLDLSEKAADEGERASVATVVTLGLEGMEDPMLTLTANTVTDLAEAYIVSDEAIYPLSLSEEELNELGNALQTDATLGLLGLLSKLPESCAPLVYAILGVE